MSEFEGDWKLCRSCVPAPAGSDAYAARPSLRFFTRVSVVKGAPCNLQLDGGAVAFMFKIV